MGHFRSNSARRSDGTRSVVALLLLACGGCSLASRDAVPILTYWGALQQVTGYRLAAPHMGVDYAAEVGRPVLAAADGEVTKLEEGTATCGTKVVIHHKPYDAYTIYCHLSSYTVDRGPVRRGSTIGYVGNTGNPGPVPHLHAELFLNGRNVDPLEHTVECFAPGVTYPSDRLVLTMPLKC